MGVPCACDQKAPGTAGSSVADVRGPAMVPFPCCGLSQSTSRQIPRRKDWCLLSTYYVPSTLHSRQASFKSGHLEQAKVLKQVFLNPQALCWAQGPQPLPLAPLEPHRLLHEPGHELQGPCERRGAMASPPPSRPGALGQPRVVNLQGLCLPGCAMGHNGVLSVSSSCPINLGCGTCAPPHVINNLEHTFMGSAISAAFNPIALYSIYMRLLCCCNYFVLYASFLPCFILLYFLIFDSHSTWAFTSQAWRPGRNTCPSEPGWPRRVLEPQLPYHCHPRVTRVILARHLPPSWKGPARWIFHEKESPGIYFLEPRASVQRTLEFLRILGLH